MRQRCRIESHHNLPHVPNSSNRTLEAAEADLAELNRRDVDQQDRALRSSRAKSHVAAQRQPRVEGDEGRNQGGVQPHGSARPRR